MHTDRRKMFRGKHRQNIYYYFNSWETRLNAHTTIAILTPKRDEVGGGKLKGSMKKASNRNRKESLHKINRRSENKRKTVVSVTLKLL